MKTTPRFLLNFWIFEFFPFDKICLLNLTSRTDAFYISIRIKNVKTANTGSVYKKNNKNFFILLPVIYISNECLWVNYWPYLGVECRTPAALVNPRARWSTLCADSRLAELAPHQCCTIELPVIENWRNVSWVSFFLDW